MLHKVLEKLIEEHQRRFENSNSNSQANRNTEIRFSPNSSNRFEKVSHSPMKHSQNEDPQSFQTTGDLENDKFRKNLLKLENNIYRAFEDLGAELRSKRKPALGHGVSHTKSLAKDKSSKIATNRSKSRPGLSASKNKNSYANLFEQRISASQQLNKQSSQAKPQKVSKGVMYDDVFIVTPKNDLHYPHHRNFETSPEAHKRRSNFTQTEPIEVVSRHISKITEQPVKVSLSRPNSLQNSIREENSIRQSQPFRQTLIKEISDHEEDTSSISINGKNKKAELKHKNAENDFKPPLSKTSVNHLEEEAKIIKKPSISSANRNSHAESIRSRDQASKSIRKSQEFSYQDSADKNEVPLNESFGSKLIRGSGIKPSITTPGLRNSIDSKSIKRDNSEPVSQKRHKSVDNVFLNDSDSEKNQKRLSENDQRLFKSQERSMEGSNSYNSHQKSEEDIKKIRRSRERLNGQDSLASSEISEHHSARRMSNRSGDINAGPNYIYTPAYDTPNTLNANSTGNNFKTDKNNSTDIHFSLSKETLEGPILSNGKPADSMRSFTDKIRANERDLYEDKQSPQIYHDYFGNGEPHLLRKNIFNENQRQSHDSEREDIVSKQSGALINRNIVNSVPFSDKNTQKRTEAEAYKINVMPPKHYDQSNISYSSKINSGILSNLAASRNDLMSNYPNNDALQSNVSEQFESQIVDPNLRLPVNGVIPEAALSREDDSHSSRGSYHRDQKGHFRQSHPKEPMLHSEFDQIEPIQKFKRNLHEMTDTVSEERPSLKLNNDLLKEMHRSEVKQVLISNGSKTLDNVRQESMRKLRNDELERNISNSVNTNAQGAFFQTRNSLGRSDHSLSRKNSSLAHNDFNLNDHSRDREDSLNSQKETKQALASYHEQDEGRSAKDSKADFGQKGPRNYGLSRQNNPYSYPDDDEDGGHLPPFRPAIPTGLFAELKAKVAEKDGKGEFNDPHKNATNKNITDNLPLITPESLQRAKEGLHKDSRRKEDLFSGTKKSIESNKTSFTDELLQARQRLHKVNSKMSDDNQHESREDIGKSGTLKKQDFVVTKQENENSSRRHLLDREIEQEAQRNSLKGTNPSIENHRRNSTKGSEALNQSLRESMTKRQSDLKVDPSKLRTSQTYKQSEKDVRNFDQEISTHKTSGSGDVYSEVRGSLNKGKDHSNSIKQSANQRESQASLKKSKEFNQQSSEIRNSRDQQGLDSFEMRQSRSNKSGITNKLSQSQTELGESVSLERQSQIALDKKPKQSKIGQPEIPSDVNPLTYEPFGKQLDLEPPKSRSPTPDRVKIQNQTQIHSKDSLGKRQQTSSMRGQPEIPRNQNPLVFEPFGKTLDLEPPKSQSPTPKREVFTRQTLSRDNSTSKNKADKISQPKVNYNIHEIRGLHQQSSKTLIPSFESEYKNGDSEQRRTNLQQTIQSSFGPIDTKKKSSTRSGADLIIKPKSKTEWQPLANQLSQEQARNIDEIIKDKAKEFVKAPMKKPGVRISEPVFQKQRADTKEQTTPNNKKMENVIRNGKKEMKIDVSPNSKVSSSNKGHDDSQATNKIRGDLSQFKRVIDNGEKQERPAISIKKSDPEKVKVKDLHAHSKLKSPNKFKDKFDEPELMPKPSLRSQKQSPNIHYDDDIIQVRMSEGKFPKPIVINYKPSQSTGIENNPKEFRDNQKQGGLFNSGMNKDIDLKNMSVEALRNSLDFDQQGLPKGPQENRNENSKEHKSGLDHQRDNDSNGSEYHSGKQASRFRNSAQNHFDRRDFKEHSFSPSNKIADSRESLSENKKDHHPSHENSKGRLPDKHIETNKRLKQSSKQSHINRGNDLELISNNSKVTQDTLLSSNNRKSLPKIQIAEIAKPILVNPEDYGKINKITGLHGKGITVTEVVNKAKIVEQKASSNKKSPSPKTIDSKLTNGLKHPAQKSPTDSVKRIPGITETNPESKVKLLNSDANQDHNFNRLNYQAERNSLLEGYNVPVQLQHVKKSIEKRKESQPSKAGRKIAPPGKERPSDVVYEQNHESTQSNQHSFDPSIASNANSNRKTPDHVRQEKPDQFFRKEDVFKRLTDPEKYQPVPALSNQNSRQGSLLEHDTTQNSQRSSGKFYARQIKPSDAPFGKPIDHNQIVLDGQKLSGQQISSRLHSQLNNDSGKQSIDAIDMRNSLGSNYKQYPYRT